MDETGIITNITASLKGQAVILVIIHVTIMTMMGPQNIMI